MKKSKVISVIAIIGIIILLILLYFSMPKKVENLSNITLKDAYGSEITDYNENVKAFTIEKHNENEKVFVNGEEYIEGKRFYEIGNYEIKVKEGMKVKKSTVKINEVEKNEENVYHIYVIAETLQTLLASLELSNDIEQQGFLWTARTSTVDLEKIKEKMPNMKLSANNGELNATDFRYKAIPEIKEYIQNILQADDNAYFKLYMAEDTFYLDLELFGKIGLNDTRYDVTMYTNGTLGYVREYELTQANKYERFLQEKKDYNNIVIGVKDNTKEYNDYPGSYMVDHNSELFNVDFNFDYMYLSTLRPNIKLLLQYPEMVKFEDKNIEKEMENANIEKVVATEEFGKLDEKEQNNFFEFVSLDKQELDEKYFTEKDGKYLIITGTVPFDGTIKKDKYKQIIEQVVEDYGEEYILLYKPHPRAIPTQEEEQFLNSFNIKVLPGKIPMEAISFVYSDLYLGGFGSSLYMSVDQGKTLFFFARDKEELFEPLDKLYDKMFSEAKFYN